MRSEVINGSRRVRIVLLQFALLPFLNGPRRFAHIVHRVTELAKYAIVYAPGFDLLLDFDKLGTGLPQLEIQPPKSVARSQKLDGNPWSSTFLGWTCADNTRLSCLARKKVCQLQFATDPRVSLHVQQTTQSAYLQSLSGFFDVPTEYRPFSLYKNNDRKAAGPSFLRFVQVVVPKSAHPF